MRHTTTSRRNRRPFALLALAAVSTAPLVACGGDTAEPAAEAPSQGAAARPAYGLVSADQAADLAAGGVTVIDVRTPEEYADGHVEGALLIDLSSPTFAEQVAELDPEGEYLVYCRSGNRSAQAVAIMQQNGIDQVWDLAGGVVGADGSDLTLVR